MEKFFTQTEITTARPFFYLEIPVLLLRFQILIPIPQPLLIFPFVVRPSRAPKLVFRSPLTPHPTLRSVQSCPSTAMRRRSARLRTWCLSTDRTIPPESPEALSFPMSLCTAHRSPPRTPPFPSRQPTRPSLYPPAPLPPLRPLDPWRPPWRRQERRRRRLRSCSGRSSGPWCRCRWATPASPTCLAPPRRWPSP